MEGVTLALEDGERLELALPDRLRVALEEALLRRLTVRVTETEEQFEGRGLGLELEELDAQKEGVSARRRRAGAGAEAGARSGGCHCSVA